MSIGHKEVFKVLTRGRWYSQLDLHAYQSARNACGAEFNRSYLVSLLKFSCLRLKSAVGLQEHHISFIPGIGWEVAVNIDCLVKAAVL